MEISLFCKDSACTHSIKYQIPIGCAADALCVHAERRCLCKLHKSLFSAPLTTVVIAVEWKAEQEYIL